jgi:nucleoside-triphosphatase
VPAHTICSVARVLLTGSPGSGKTTLAGRVVDVLRERGEPLAGFVTSEIRRGGRRTGFTIRGVGGLERTLAVRGRPGPRVGAYGVDLRAFEEVALLEIENGLELGSTLVVDEIGKMELLSARFRELVGEIFRAPCVLATVGDHHDPLLEEIRGRRDVIALAVYARDIDPHDLADVVTDVRAAAQ